MPLFDAKGEGNPPIDRSADDAALQSSNGTTWCIRHAAQRGQMVSELRVGRWATRSCRNPAADIGAWAFGIFARGDEMIGNRSAAQATT